MSSFALEAWPGSLRDDGLVAHYDGQPPARRISALQRLREAVDGESVSESLRDQIHSLFASLVAVAGQHTEIENEATAALMPAVRLAAARATSGFDGHAAHDFREEAGGLIWQRLKAGKFNPEFGVFEAWCYTVLRNELVSRYRRMKTDALAKATPLLGSSVDRPSGMGVEPRTEDLRPLLERAIDSSEFMRAPFGDGDQERIEQLLVTSRLVLLSLSGLWRKIPALCWEQWVKEAKAAMPFPPDGFAELETQGEREEWLAGALGLSSVTVTQRWYRGRSVLAGLECLRSLHS